MSGRACSVCSRPDRPEIDAAIVTAESKRGIARRFAVSPDAVERHARAHVGRSLVRAAARKGERLDDELLGKARTREADSERFEESLLSKVARLEADARRLGEKAESEGDLRCALAAVRELLDTVKLLHELTPAPTPTEADMQRVMEWMAEEAGLSVDEMRASCENVVRIKAEILAGRTPPHTERPAPVALPLPAPAAPPPDAPAQAAPAPAPPPSPSDE